MVSRIPTGVQGNQSSTFADVSAHGRYVAFASDASNFGGGGSTAGSDVFLRDMRTGQITYVSHAPSGADGNGASGFPSLAADAVAVAYQSEATNLHPADTHPSDGIFL